MAAAACGTAMTTCSNPTSPTCVNAPDGGFAGAITAALFLRRFVPDGHRLGASRHLRLAPIGQARPAQGRRGAGPARRMGDAEGPLRMTANTHRRPHPRRQSRRAGLRPHLPRAGRELPRRARRAARHAADRSGDLPAGRRRRLHGLRRRRDDRSGPASPSSRAARARPTPASASMSRCRIRSR